MIFFMDKNCNELKKFFSYCRRFYLEATNFSQLELFSLFSTQTHLSVWNSAPYLELAHFNIAICFVTMTTASVWTRVKVSPTPGHVTRSVLPDLMLLLRKLCREQLLLMSGLQCIPCSFVVSLNLTLIGDQKFLFSNFSLAKIRVSVNHGAFKTSVINKNLTIHIPLQRDSRRQRRNTRDTPKPDQQGSRNKPDLRFLVQPELFLRRTLPLVPVSDRCCLFLPLLLLHFYPSLGGKCILQCYW